MSFFWVTRSLVSTGYCFIWVLTQPLPSHWQIKISFQRGKWAMTLVDRSLGCVIKELEMWKKWRRLVAEYKIPCSGLSLVPAEVHGSSWPNPVGRGGFFLVSAMINEEPAQIAYGSCRRKQSRHRWIGLPRTVGFYMGSCKVVHHRGRCRLLSAAWEIN